MSIDEKQFNRSIEHKRTQVEYRTIELNLHSVIIMSNTRHLFHASTVTCIMPTNNDAFEIINFKLRCVDGGSCMSFAIFFTGFLSIRIECVFFSSSWLSLLLWKRNPLIQSLLVSVFFMIFLSIDLRCSHTHSNTYKYTQSHKRHMNNVY